MCFCGILVNEKERHTLEGVENAKMRIRNEIRDIKDRIKLAQESIQTLKEKVEAEEQTVEESA